MTTSTQEKVVEAIRSRHKPDRRIQISRTIPNFFLGELVVVEVFKDGQPPEENYAYVLPVTGVEATFLSMDDLANWSSQRSYRGDGLLSKLNVNTVPGLIAILITLTVCVIVPVQMFVNKGAPQVPEIFGNALTTILGFYFGSQVAKSADKAAERKSATLHDSHSQRSEPSKG